VSWGRDRDNESHLRELVGAFRERTERPLFVKLPPFTSDTERDVVLALAGIATEAGADGLVCANTRPVADRRLSVGAGGLSGKALWERTPRIVETVRRATGRPIVACGGISTSEDVATALEAGAAAVQVYTAFVYEGPHLPGRLSRGLGDAVSSDAGDVAPTSNASS
jgi:dihydroorotate dehydrogenase